MSSLPRSVFGAPRINLLVVSDTPRNALHAGDLHQRKNAKIPPQRTFPRHPRLPSRSGKSHPLTHPGPSPTVLGGYEGESLPFPPVLWPEAEKSYRYDAM